MTSFGLVTDLVGAVELNSFEVAFLGVAMGIVDAMTFLYLYRKKRKV